MSILFLIILFGLIIMSGAYLLRYVLSDKNTPKGLAIIHGSAAIFSIILLLIASFFYHPLIYSLLIFILAAIGGGFLFSFDLLEKKIPKALAIGHGLVAISGFLLLTLICVRYL